MAVTRDQAYDPNTVLIGAGLSASALAVAEVIPPLRHTVADYAEAAGIEGDRLDAVRLAVSEAISNVVLHAYADQPGYVHVSCGVAGDELWILVADDGRGHNADPIRAGLGWGLAFITDAADEFTLGERVDGGTEARIVFRLHSVAEAVH